MLASKIPGLLRSKSCVKGLALIFLISLRQTSLIILTTKKNHDTNALMFTIQNHNKKEGITQGDALSLLAHRSYNTRASQCSTSGYDINRASGIGANDLYAIVSTYI